MRFPLAALGFLILSFIFFVCFAVTSLMIEETTDALEPYATDINDPRFDDQLAVVPIAFGVIFILFFIFGILLLFIIESWSDEPEYYYRRPYR